jgi:hypothetical protein
MDIGRSGSSRQLRWSCHPTSCSGGGSLDRSSTDPITCRGALERRDASDRRDRTPSVRTGSVPQTAEHGHERSPTVTSGQENRQANRLLTQAARTTPAAVSDCGPEDHEACVSKDPHSHVDPNEGT